MKDTDVFEGKTLHNLLKDVYDHTDSRRARIMHLVTTLSGYVTNSDAAVVFAPIIRDYLDVLIKNDEHLVKLGTIAQRIISSEAYKSGGASIDELLSEEEKQSLLSEVKQLNEVVVQLDEQTVANNPIVIKALTSGPDAATHSQ